MVEPRDMGARVAVLEAQGKSMADLVQGQQKIAHDLVAKLATVTARLGVLQWLVFTLVGTNVVGVAGLLVLIFQRLP